MGHHGSHFEGSGADLAARCERSLEMLVAAAAVPHECAQPPEWLVDGGYRGETGMDHGQPTGKGRELLVERGARSASRR